MTSFQAEGRANEDAFQTRAAGGQGTQDDVARPHDIPISELPASLFVFDYDATLAFLQVDWESVRKDLSRVAFARGFESEFRPLWPEMARFKRLAGAQHMSDLFTVLERHERIGAERQIPRTEIVDEVKRLSELGKRIAIFSTNLHATLELGLLGLGLCVQAIVGADDVENWKPHPEGLELVLARTGYSRGQAVFIGDAWRDARAAKAAGIDFRYV